MGRDTAILAGALAIPVLEIYRGVHETATAVGTAAVALPATNLSNRKAMIVQNIHASQNLFLGGSPPQYILGEHRKVGQLFIPDGATEKRVKWNLSGGGTNEWYATTTAGGNPGLTAVEVLYYKTLGGTETVGTEGTKGALAAEHNWDFADGDTLGYDTLYIRTSGNTAAHSPDKKYELLLSYFNMPTATGGIKLAAGASLTISLDSVCRIFGVADGAATTTISLELL